MESGIVSLGRVFNGDEELAELLTTNKLSEIACLALYLSYEKKSGEASSWRPLIKELDMARARGLENCETPILWPEEEREALLAGSPLEGLTRARIQGIHDEYPELETLWFRNDNLFQQYPFECAPHQIPLFTQSFHSMARYPPAPWLLPLKLSRSPTEQFSKKTFLAAFAAVQSCVVHLRGEGVSLANRFAIVPLGPPLAAFETRSSAAIHPEGGEAVALNAGRDYQEGEPIEVWPGPQPNARLLLNYGFCDLNNPYDKLVIRAELMADDPLFRCGLCGWLTANE